MARRRGSGGLDCSATLAGNRVGSSFILLGRSFRMFVRTESLVPDWEYQASCSSRRQEAQISSENRKLDAKSEPPNVGCYHF